jgi:hypothetical protein
VTLHVPNPHQAAGSRQKPKTLTMTTNLKSNEASPFVTKADFEDFLASYKTDLEAFATKTDLEAFATKAEFEDFLTSYKTDTKTLLDALAANKAEILNAMVKDKEERINFNTMIISRMDAFENQLNNMRPSRYDESDDEVQ